MRNKKLIIVFGMILIVGTFVYVSAIFVIDGASDAVVVSSLEKGLVGYWPLDGDNYNSATNRVTDKTPYSNHGANSGASLTTGRMGENNGSMDFGGSYYINCGNDESLQVIGNQTYAFWIYPTSFVARRNPINKAYGGEGTITLEIAGTFSYYWGTGGGNVQPYQGQGTNRTILLNQWTHVAHVRDLASNEMIWYINGIPAGTVAPSYSAAVASSNDLWIGDGYVSPIAGKMVDVRIYNRALSADEIQLLYDSHKPKASLGSTSKGLILDMPLTSRYTKSETAGSEIMTDRTPYSNDGTNHGGVVGSDFTSFDGNDWIGEIEDPNFLEPESITVSAWINMDTDAPTARNIWLTKWYGYSMEIQADTRIPYFRLYGPGDVYSNTSLTLGKWHHFVGTYDSSIGRRAYLDGNLVGTGSGSNAITYSRSNPLNIGRYYGGIYFKGDISGVKIYNRALSDEEIKLLYDKGRQ